MANALSAQIIFQHQDWQAIPYREFIALELKRNGFDSTLPSYASAAGLALAYINHGRWVVDCPSGDGGALVITKAEPFFMCPYCANEANGGRWYRIVIPPNAADIEAALLARPAIRGWEARHRNWHPGTLLQQLLDENLERLGGWER